MSVLIGIDIGTRYTKVVHAESKTKPCLVDAFLFPTPYISKTKKVDPRNFVNQITSHIPEKLIKDSYIGVSIPSTLVSVMVVNLPKMSMKELSVASVAEAKRKMIPPPSPDSVFESLILRETTVAKIPQYEVLIMKTEKSHVKEILSLFGAFGEVTPFMIVPICWTTVSLFSSQSEFLKKTIAFIDIGYNFINIAIVRQGKLQFLRSVRFGIEEIISYISTTLGVSSQAAEGLIEDKGIPEIEIDGKDRVKISEEIMRQKYEASLRKGEKKEINYLELRLLWQTKIEKIIQEVRRTFIYYSQQFEDEVGGSFFLGGGSIIKGLVPLVTKKVRGKCHILDPLESGIFSLKKNVAMEGGSSLFASALSIVAGMVAARKERKSINFLPPELRVSRLIMLRQLGFTIFSFVISWAIIFNYISLFIQDRSLKNKIGGIDFSISRRSNIGNILEKLENQRKDVGERRKKIEQVIKTRVDLPSVLEEIDKLLPEKITLMEFSMSKGGESNSQDFSKEKTQMSQGRRKENFQSGKNGNNSYAGNSEGNYKIVIKAFCDADYKNAFKLAQRFKNNLEKFVNFEKVVLLPPKLGKISPLTGKFPKVILTQPKRRQFVLKIDYVPLQK